jgi:deoxyuridine 5'-triphosphate nucleotidohydrolase
MKYSVGIYSLNPKKTTFPSYATEYSSCFDLTFCPPEEELTVDGYDSRNNKFTSPFIQGQMLIMPGARVLVPTAMIFDLMNVVNVSFWTAKKKNENIIDSENYFSTESYIPDRDDIYSMKIYPRSGLSLKFGLGLINSVGIIDGDYTNQLYVPMINHSDKEVTISAGDRIAQAEILKNGVPLRTTFHWLTSSPKEAGNRKGGFGSTGGRLSMTEIKSS